MIRTMDRERLAPVIGVDGIQVCVTPGPDGSVGVAVSGEIDFHSAAALRRAVLAALTSYGGPVAIDLRDATFCDCGGLNALLTARAHAEQACRPLCVTGASRQVERLLLLTGTRACLM
ncbi:STAS domain-containing protein [Streptomyces sp. NPDC054865]